MLGIGTEASIFLYAGLSGIIVLSVYKILTCFRKIIPHSSLAVGIEDLIFWLGVSGYLFYQMYTTTYGSIRWFFILGVVGGALTAKFVSILLKKIYDNIEKKLEKFRRNR